ncbi:MAG TPA: methylated-DNA--[protein]-cysteine S-methyltransferase [Rhizomicrobium sp.]|jgi:methylated-DNA-[protein]-cysteine S-methyltransferase|nr:methylated-DNA--[protein]-cysteine S-methyltransferase [Rhizomicrobium sp.]
MSQSPHRWGHIPTRFAPFAAAVDGGGRLVRFWLDAAKGGGPRGVHDEAAIAPIRAQVDEYCAGRRRDFALEFHAEEGSDFERGVWAAMCEIPFGETVSYGAIARRLGDPNAARAVGLACNSNPIPLVVPCHRVVGADGALVGFGGGLALKRALLDFESVVVGRPRDLFARA